MIDQMRRPAPEGNNAGETVTSAAVVLVKNLQSVDKTKN